MEQPMFDEPSSSVEFGGSTSEEFENYQMFTYYYSNMSRLESTGLPLYIVTL